MADRNITKKGCKSGKGSILPPTTKGIMNNGTETEGNNENALSLSLSPEKKALQNTLVLQNIFRFLPYNDLLTCRSVDFPYWKSEAEYLLNQRLILSITWKKIQPTIDMVQTFHGKVTQFEFENLSELLSNLETFEKGFEIWLTVAGLSSSEVKPFLGKFGNVICNLTLLYPLSDTPPSDLQQMISSLPNLSRLCLNDIPTLWKSYKKMFYNPNSSSSTSNDSLYLLPQIKTVTFGSSDCYYPELLMSLFQLMPNLNSIFNFPICCIPSSTASSKLKLDKIKSVDLSKLSVIGGKGLETECPISRIANISREIKLHEAHLCIPFGFTERWATSWKSCCQSLSSILENNKSTLELLTIDPLSLYYPEMKAVKKLCLTDLGSGVKFFGMNFDAGKSFPNLVEVTLKFELTNFRKFFPGDATTETRFYGVTSLNIDSFHDVFMTDKSVEQVARFFPNVTRFATDGDIRGLERHLGQVFWLWPKLISLKLTVKVHDFIAYDDYTLDPVFTGLSPNMCNKLREKINEKINVDFNKYQPNFAISNMTDLKELTLIFDGEYGEKQEIIPFLSHVAAFYGFQRVPDLKVTCAIPWDNRDKEKIQEMLIPISGYVKLNPNYIEPYYSDI